MYIYLYIFLMSIITYFYLFFNVISCESFWMQKLCVKYITLYSNWVCVCVCVWVYDCVCAKTWPRREQMEVYTQQLFLLPLLSLSLSQLQNFGQGM